MALYTILFGISIFMIALVMAIIKKMFFHWKEEHKIEQMVVATTDRPAVSVIIYTDKCVIRMRRYADDMCLYDVLSKSDVELSKHNFDSINIAPDVATDESELKPRNQEEGIDNNIQSDPL